MPLTTIYTSRLILSKLDSSYCSDRYVNWMNDNEVYQYLETGGSYTLEQLAVFLKNVEKQDILFWAIKIKHTEKHIGNIKIDPVNIRHGYAEYGIMMGDRTEWGKGYAKEASKAVLDYCFSELRLRKVTLGVVEDNGLAVSLYQTLGFEIEGIYKKHGIYNNKLCNVLRMALFNPIIDNEPNQ